MFLRVSAVPWTAHGFSAGQDLAILQVERLHHLPDEAVGQHNRRIAILVGQFEGEDGQVGHFLHGGGARTRLR